MTYKEELFKRARADLDNLVQKLEGKTFDECVKEMDCFNATKEHFEIRVGVITALVRNFDEEGFEPAISDYISIHDDKNDKLYESVIFE